MALQYSPKIVRDGLVMCLDPSQNKSYPRDLPVKGGLLLWLDAADDSTFSYSSGTVVSQWRDKSGNNFHASQSTTSQQPSRNTTNNSRKSVFFNASSRLDYMLISSGISLPTDASIFIVYKPSTQIYQYAVLIDNYHGQGGNYGFVIQRVSTNTQFYYANAGDGAGFIDTAASPWTYTDNVIQLLSLNKSTTVGTPYISGTAQTPRSVRGDTAQSTTGLAIGYWGYGGGRYYNGDMCEILIFNRSLSSAEMKLVHTYLGQKWGILNTDRSIIDLSGFNDNGLLGNGSTSNMPLFDYYNKGAFKFYASNKYIKLGNNTTINQFTGDFTISLWAMAMAENSNYGNLIGDYYTAGVQTTNEWQIMMNNSSTALNVYRHGTGYVINNTASGFSANTWINVVLTRVGSAISLYANNTVIATATNSSVFGSATGSVNIGIDGNNAAEPFSGLISNVLIYQKGLSAAEVAQNYQAQKSKFDNTIVQQGLVFNIDAGNPYSYAGAGSTWYDVSGNNYNGTLISSPTYSTNNGGSLAFNGSSQYASGFGSSIVPTSSAAYAISVWCYRDSNDASYRELLSQWTSANSGNSFYFGFNNSLVRFTDNWQSITVSGAGSAGVWMNLVGVYTVSNAYIYLNGSLAATKGSGFSYTGTGALIVGRQGELTSEYFDGKIGHILIYNRSLTAAEVLQNYNATKGRFGL